MTNIWTYLHLPANTILHLRVSHTINCHPNIISLSLWYWNFEQNLIWNISLIGNRLYTYLNWQTSLCGPSWSWSYSGGIYNYPCNQCLSLQHGTKIYDKRDDFNFKIINFPNMCSNIPASPAYGVYISQLIRYARASSNYSDFLKRHLHLRNRLLDQGYKKIRLIRSLKKFIFRYQDLVEIYSVSAETIISDAFSYSENV
jgi:hypothetical protein